jgi:hypothetical protein
VPSLYQRIESAGISSRVMTGAIIATDSLFVTRLSELQHGQRTSQWRRQRRTERCERFVCIEEHRLDDPDG